MGVISKEENLLEAGRYRNGRVLSDFLGNAKTTLLVSTKWTGLASHTYTVPYTPSLASNGPYSSVLGIHFTTRVAPTMVRREHNNGISSVRVDTDKKQRHNHTTTGQKRVALIP